MTTTHKEKNVRKTLTAYFSLSFITALGITAVWAFNYDSLTGPDQYGTSTAKLLSYSSKNYVIEQDVINLTLLGKEATRSPEIDRIIFYDADNNVLGVVGTSKTGPHYTKPITEGGVLAGYVTVSLNRPMFSALPISLLLIGSLLVVISVTLGVFLITFPKNQKSNAIPIVSVPNKKESPAYSIFVNIHNRLSLSAKAKQSAIEEALAMASEVCALRPGAGIRLSDQGILVLLDKEGTSPYEGIKAGWLLQQLLVELETPALHRFFLSTCMCKEKPSELSQTATDLFSAKEANLAFRIASLTKENSISLSEDLFASFTDSQKNCCQSFEHPVLQDIAEGQKFYTLNMDKDETETIRQQVNMILGFK